MVELPLVELEVPLDGWAPSISARRTHLRTVSTAEPNMSAIEQLASTLTRYAAAPSRTIERYKPSRFLGGGVATLSVKNCQQTFRVSHSETWEVVVAPVPLPGET